MKKRVLAALLALVMLFGALPMSVFAEDLETVEGPSGTFEPDEPEKYTYICITILTMLGLAAPSGTSSMDPQRTPVTRTRLIARR